MNVNPSDQRLRNVGRIAPLDIDAKMFPQGFRKKFAVWAKVPPHLQEIKNTLWIFLGMVYHVWVDPQKTRHIWVGEFRSRVDYCHHARDLDGFPADGLLRFYVVLDEAEAVDWLALNKYRHPAPIDNSETSPGLTSAIIEEARGIDTPPNNLSISTAGKPVSRSIVLTSEEDEPIVWGVAKKRLSPGQYRVVKALLDAHSERLSTDRLAIHSQTEDPVGMIDRLRRDRDWADALEKPGQAHGGYGIRSKRPRTTKPNKG